MSQVLTQVKILANSAHIGNLIQNLRFNMFKYFPEDEPGIDGNGPFRYRNIS